MTLGGMGCGTGTRQWHGEGGSEGRARTIEENLEKLEPTGMAGGVHRRATERFQQPQRPGGRDEGGWTGGERARLAQTPLGAHTGCGARGSGWAEDRAQQRQAADRSRIKPSLEHGGALVAKMGVAWELRRGVKIAGRVNGHGHASAFPCRHTTGCGLQPERHDRHRRRQPVAGDEAERWHERDDDDNDDDDGGVRRGGDGEQRRVGVAMQRWVGDRALGCPCRRRVHGLQGHTSRAAILAPSRLS